MRIFILSFMSVFIAQSCKTQEFKNEFLIGTYVKKGRTDKIELKDNSLYILYNSKNLGDLALDQCDILSKGQWKQISTDVVDLTSENYYSKEDGYKYDLKQETKFSKDSVYININLHKDFETSIPTPEFSILFNYKTSKQIETTNNKIVISKKDYSLIGVKNQVNLDLVFKPSGQTRYYNRLRYEILQDFPLDVEKNNYFTISLPNFNQCFYEFEPYYHSYIYVKDKKTLMWQGEEWIKQ